MCDCKSKVEASLVERLKASFPDARDHSAELQGYGFAVDGNLWKWKPAKGAMVVSFCPFCGEKVEAANVQPAATAELPPCVGCENFKQGVCHAADQWKDFSCRVPAIGHNIIDVVRRPGEPCRV